MLGFKGTGFRGLGFKGLWVWGSRVWSLESGLYTGCIRVCTVVVCRFCATFVRLAFCAIQFVFILAWTLEFQVWAFGLRVCKLWLWLRVSSDFEDVAFRRP